MGADVGILNLEGKLLESVGISQAGSNLSFSMVEGMPAEEVVSKSIATWTYNYSPIWEELGWNPWRWFDAEGDQIAITPEVHRLLLSKMVALLDLPDQNRSRNQSEGYWAATPKNAVDMIEWILKWASKPGAAFIVRGSR